MEPIDYIRPTSLAEAQAALARPGACALAGGTDLIVQLREGRRKASHLVDLKSVDELVGVSEASDGGLSLGSATAVAHLAEDKRVRERYPALVTSLGMIGSKQIQNRATLGGNICNAAPSADGVPPLIGYGAQCTMAGPLGQRVVALEDLFDEPGRPKLAPGEFLISIGLPPPQPRSAGCYQRFTPRREMDIAVVGVCSWLSLGDDGLIEAARVVLASVAPRPIRSCSAEAALVGQSPDVAAFTGAGEAAVGDAMPISDTRGSADYRRALVQTLTQRTLAAAAAALKG